MSSVDELKTLRDQIRRGLERAKRRAHDPLPAMSRHEAEQRQKLMDRIDDDIRRLEPRADANVR